VHKFGAEKPISWAKRAHFDFFTIDFTVWKHILSAGGDALKPCCWFSSVVARHIIKSNNSLILWRNFLFFKTCLLGTLVGYHKTNYKNDGVLCTTRLLVEGIARTTRFVWALEPHSALHQMPYESLSYQNPPSIRQNKFLKKFIS
jgi:hypothetical protein